MRLEFFQDFNNLSFKNGSLDEKGFYWNPKEPLSNLFFEESVLQKQAVLGRTPGRTPMEPLYLRVYLKIVLRVCGVVVPRDATEPQEKGGRG